MNLSRFSLRAALLLSLLAVCSSLFAPQSFASDGYILASNKPIALIAATVYPSEQIKILLPDGMSPHDYSLKPSDIRKINNAQQVIWAGAAIEPFLQKLAKQQRTQWLDLNSLLEESEQTDHHSHQHHDQHSWLNADLAIKLHQLLAQQRGQATQPGFSQQLQQVIQQGQVLLSDKQEKNYIVYHPAYSDWQKAMKLRAPIIISNNPEQKVGLKHFNFLRQKIQQGSVHCIVTEPQFDKKLINKLRQVASNKHPLNVVSLDPLANHIDVTKTAYSDWYFQMAVKLSNCLQ